MSVCEIASAAGARAGSVCAGRDLIIIQDTSGIALGGRKKKRQGYGPVCGGGAARGVLLHAALCLDAADGRALGLADLALWNRAGGARVTARRERDFAERESARWLAALEHAAARLGEARSRLVVGDAESDIFRLFALRPPSVDCLVRAGQDRLARLQEASEGEAPGEERLSALCARLPLMGRTALNLPARPGRKARVLELEVRFARVWLKRPAAAAGLPDEVGMTLIEAREAEPRKAEAGAPLCWRLLTSLPAADLAAALAMLAAYRRRWVIEEYFHILKTGGFDIEAMEIAEPQAMLRFCAAAAVAAVTVLQLVKGREDAASSASPAFEAQELRLLERLRPALEGKTRKQKNPHPPNSAAWAAWIIARLGGWDGYYGKPGPKTFRWGMQAFNAIKIGASLKENV